MDSRKLHNPQANPPAPTTASRGLAAGCGA